jgi:hypothetical protein
MNSAEHESQKAEALREAHELGGHMFCMKPAEDTDKARVKHHNAKRQRKGNPHQIEIVLELV